MILANNKINYTIEDVKSLLNKLNNDLLSHDFQHKAFSVEEVEMFDFIVPGENESNKIMFDFWIDLNTDYVIDCYVYAAHDGSKIEFDFFGDVKILNAIVDVREYL